MTEVNKKDANVDLARILYIHYPFRFRKDKKNKVRVLIDFGSEVNAITPAYASKLGLKIRRIDVEAQKINGSTLKIFRMVLASFQVENKQSQA